MPELPEVETTRRGILPYVAGRSVSDVLVREPRLRWPVPAELGQWLRGQRIETVDRRAKYLLFRTSTGTLILHLGMSGSLRILLTAPMPPGAHDHLDILLEGDVRLRYTDPRRFGSVHWIAGDPLQHPLLRDLGPEPFDPTFTGDYLYRLSRSRRTAIKTFLMDSDVVVGVGNIYASESLFLAGIRPNLSAGEVGLVRYRRVVDAIRQVLSAAIEAGGTTLRDFVNGDGQPGYFSQWLNAYGRGGEPCRVCGEAIRLIRQGQRATYYCPRCQR